MLSHTVTIKFPTRRRRILAFSDLQYDLDFKPQQLDRLSHCLRSEIAKSHIDYVFFLGDLVNSLHVLEDEVAYAKLLNFLRQIAQTAPLIIVLGNHDEYYYRSNKYLERPDLYHKLHNDLQSIVDVHVLGTDQEIDSPIFDDGAIRVLGLSLPRACYYKQGTTRETHRKGQLAFDRLIGQYLPQLTSVQDRDRYVLMHSPTYLSPCLLNQDFLVLAGHMHNGVVPPILDELTRFTHRGLVGPGLCRTGLRDHQFELFPRYARLQPTLQRPWHTVQPSTYFGSGIFKLLNVFYPKVSYSIIIDDPSIPKLKVSASYHHKT